MANRNLHKFPQRENPEWDDGSPRPPHERGGEVKRFHDATRGRLGAVVGDELKEVPGYLDALHAVPKENLFVNVGQTREPPPFLREVENDVPEAQSALSTGSLPEKPDESLSKSVAVGGAIGAAIPVVQGLLLAAKAGAGVSAAGASGIGSVLFTYLAGPSAAIGGLAVGGGILGRFIGKKFHRPGTGAALGAGVGLGAGYALVGASLPAFAIPLAVGAAVGAGIYGIRRLFKGK